MKKNSQIHKVFRLTDILISASLIVVGLLLVIFIPSWNWLGYPLLITGAFMLPFYRTGFRLEGISGLFRKEELNLPNECKAEIASYVEGSSDELNIDPFYKGGLILELFYTKDRTKMYGQLFSFDSNGIYTKQCELSELSAAKVETLRKFES